MPPANRKVLHLINGEFYSGAERVQDLLAIYMDDNGFEVTLGCTKPMSFIERCKCNPQQIIKFPMKSRLDLAQAFKIAKYLKNTGFDIIHTHTPRTALIGGIAAKLARLPLVHHLHSPTSRDTEQGIRNRINAFIENRTIHNANHIIAVSNSLQNYLIDYGVDKNKISVVWNGVETNKYIVRQTTDDHLTVGTVALFRPRKGLEVLIDAMALLVSEGRNIILRAVGEFETPDYEKEILSLVQRHGIGEHIEWVGFTDDIASEFSRMDVFVLPSLYGEGLPMVVLEAMANKVPVISTRVEGVPEALPSDEFGMLVEPGHGAPLAECIARLANDSEKRALLAENAYQRQKEHFSAESMAQGVATVYEKILSN